MWCVQLCLSTFIKRLAVICSKFVLFRCLFDKRNVLTRSQKILTHLILVLDVFDESNFNYCGPAINEN